MNPLIECVPNFSEGIDLNVIRQITDAIESVEGVRLVNVDPGKATNRTVVTFAGAPEPVLEAAFRAIAKAAAGSGGAARQRASIASRSASMRSAWAQAASAFPDRIRARINRICAPSSNGCR